MTVRTVFPVRNYDLAATLGSGQAFRWREREQGWEGVIGSRWVRLCAGENRIVAETVEPVADWRWLEDYLQVQANLDEVLATFPADEPMQAALSACPGLRLLRQDPWECLASFICSSTKQIVQIRQIVAALCQRFGEPVPVPAGWPATFSFPLAERIAQASEADLRECKMGFRAPYLKATAQALVAGNVELDKLFLLTLPKARDKLMECPGVGPKIADCVLLFAYGFARAFPVDVWIMKAVQQLYFPRRGVKPARLRHFTETHFGPNAGYAQQYLFHYMRTR